MPPSGRTKKRPYNRRQPMTEDHKTRLAEGRRMGRVVDDYLRAIETNRPRRGRPRTRESAAHQLDAVNAELRTASGLRKLELLQRRRGLQDEIQTPTKSNGADVKLLEKEFVGVARQYAKKRGIEYGSFRAVGVPATVLRAAGIRRGAQV